MVQEIFHSMKTKAGKRGWIVVKIDLEKTYDRLKWNFVKDTLQDIGIPNNIVDIIWSCIFTPSIRLLWNGEALLRIFSNQRHSKRRSYFSYLFVLCFEHLFQLISVVVDQRVWCPIRLFRHGPLISHLAFAYDLILFMKALVEQVHSIKNILNLFCKSSKQKISLEKS